MLKQLPFTCKQNFALTVTFQHFFSIPAITGINDCTVIPSAFRIIEALDQPDADKVQMENNIQTDPTDSIFTVNSIPPITLAVFHGLLSCSI